MTVLELALAICIGVFGADLLNFLFKSVVGYYTYKLYNRRRQEALKALGSLMQGQKRAEDDSFGPFDFPGGGPGTIN